MPKKLIPLAVMGLVMLSCTLPGLITPKNISEEDLPVIHGIVWEDAAADGLQGFGEEGIPGITVELITVEDIGDGLFNVGSISKTVTDANGKYSFRVPQNSDYHSLDKDNPDEWFQVVFRPNSSEWDFTAKDAGDDTRDSDAKQRAVPYRNNGDQGGEMGSSHAIDLTTNADGNWISHVVDAGLLRISGTRGPSSDELTAINGIVWLDKDGNGVREGNESGIEGVEVVLERVGMDTPERIITDSSGEYQFFLPADRNADQFYKIRVVPPSGFGFTDRDVGGDDRTDSDVNSDGSTEEFRYIEPRDERLWSAGLIESSSVTTTDDAGDCTDLNSQTQSDCAADLIRFEVGIDAVTHEVALIFGFPQPTDLSVLEICGGFNTDGDRNTGTGQGLLDGVETLVCYSGFDRSVYKLRYNPDGSLAGSEVLDNDQARMLEGVGSGLAESATLVIQSDVLGEPGEIGDVVSVMASVMLPPTLVDVSESVQLPPGFGEGTMP